MLCAAESLGRSSKTFNESFAADRSSPSAINGCARTAAAKCCLANVSLSSLAAIVGTRGSVVFTVARWAQPHSAKIDNAKTTLFHDFIVGFAIRFEPSQARCNERRGW